MGVKFSTCNVLTCTTIISHVITFNLDLPVVSSALNANVIPVVIAFSGPHQLYTKQAGCNSDTILCTDSDSLTPKQIMYMKLVLLLTLAGDWVWASSSGGGKQRLYSWHTHDILGTLMNIF